MFTCNASSLPNIDYINFGKTRTTFDDSIFTSEVNLLWLQKPLEMASMISKLIELGIHPITCYQICSIILFNNSPMILQNTDIFRHLHQVCQLNVFHFQYMISFYSIMLTLSCTDNFQPSADFQSCVCLKFLSADKSKCVKSCEEIGETSFDGRCVKEIMFKSVYSNQECVDLFGIGSVVDFSNWQNPDCMCDFYSGYVGGTNSTCTRCQDINQIISQDRKSCISCSSVYGVGSIYLKSQSVYEQTCVCDNSQGFAGDQNNLCTDCWIQNLEASGTYCVSCTGNQVLQEHICQDCPANTVPSKDYKQCLSNNVANTEDCIAKFNQGSIWDGASGCKCDNANGFAGQPNSFCTDCWRQNKIVSGSSCVPCDNSFEVFHESSCQNCSKMNLVLNLHKNECMTCSAKYGEGSIYMSFETCKCDEMKGFAGFQNSICTNCWWLGKIVQSSICVSCNVNRIFQNGRCEECPNGFVVSIDGNSCTTCNDKYGVGSIYNINQIGTCSCDNANGFVAFGENSQCIDCLRSDSQDKQLCSNACGTKETWDSAQKKCVCDVASGYGGVSGACSCDIDKGYAGIDICTKCWDQAKIATLSGCQDCPANEVFAPNSLSQCSCDSSKGYSGLPGSCSCSQPGFALTLGVCWNCAQNNQVTSPSGCQACPEFEKINPSTKACVCDSSLGYTGVSGGCYCNFGVGLIQAIDNNGVKSCVCKSSNGHVLDAASPSVSCKCDASTGHAGQPGACFCDSSTGHFGYPGFCMCNFNLQFVGSAGSCKNCAALNAHASQFNGAYFCRCNGDSGYGSPDAGGTCRLCASANSVVQVDSQGQFQCVACAATEKVVKNMCVGA
ncbi:Growth_factor receptor cysteine-rich domain superfamily [Hexamita inflata]|uniref:Growth factor receptor cysteine-rich domain superfamily n=1 Tax=Hexamita inflata TaxID=28002 RepID=A0AA86QVJ6_9EUKA|nr:Growth factor receptor cysteine-rich domain superfamily [Hexamita inflata]